MKHRKLTIADLIAHKEKPLQQTAEVYVPGMDGTIEIKRLPLVEYQELILDVNNAQTAAEQLRATFNLIYSFCPILHAQETLDACGCKGAPTDVVPLVFREDAGDMQAVTSAILEMYGNGTRDEIKN